MDALFAAVVATAAVGITLWIYLRREPPVPGRGLLAALRAAAVVLVVLLLVNPSLPGGEGADGTRGPSVLLDASLSMSARDSAGRTAWQAAVERAREVAGSDGRVLLFGTSLRTLTPEALPEAAPGDAGSRLAPALEQATALGGGEVRVLSDLRIDDPVAVASAAAAPGLAVGFEAVGEGIRNAGLGAVEAPAALEPGEEGTVEATLHGESGAGASEAAAGTDAEAADGAGGEPGDGADSDEPVDSVDVELRLGDRLLAVGWSALPPAGRTLRQSLAFTAPDEPGTHRLELRIDLQDDGFGPDDRRVLHLDVREEREGLLVLSLRPDWEPRYLMPVLEQVTGLRGRGFLRLADGRWLPMDGGDAEAGDAPESDGSGQPTDGAGAGAAPAASGASGLRRPVDPGAVREALDDAELLVVHGLHDEVPDWLAEALGAAPRLLVLPASAEGAQRTGVTVQRWREGEWYPDPELPPSPLAGELSGVSLEGLPPLSGVLPLAGVTPDERTPLRVRAGDGEDVEAALVLLTDEERRTAVGLASGYWRWGARDGPPREAYRRLWSAVSGWLLRAPVGPDEPEVAPRDRPAPRGEPVVWRVRGDVGDTLSIEVVGDDSTVVDTTVAAPDGEVRTPALPPGRYAYTVRAPDLPPDGAAGELEVDAYSPEMLRRPTRPDPGEGAEPGETAVADAGRPLRTHPLPYLAILVLLSVEWIGRRRQGLR